MPENDRCEHNKVPANCPICNPILDPATDK